MAATRAVLRPMPASERQAHISKKLQCSPESCHNLFFDRLKLRGRLSYVRNQIFFHLWKVVLPQVVGDRKAEANYHLVLINLARQDVPDFVKCWCVLRTNRPETLPLAFKTSLRSHRPRCVPAFASHEFGHTTFRNWHGVSAAWNATTTTRRCRSPTSRGAVASETLRRDLPKSAQLR